MGERLLCKQEVIGSIPFTSTTDAAARLRHERQPRLRGESERRRCRRRRCCAGHDREGPSLPPGSAKGSAGDGLRSSGSGNRACCLTG